MGEGDFRRADPGDVVITPKGSKGCGESLFPGMKARAIREEADAGLDAYVRPGRS